MLISFVLKFCLGSLTSLVALLQQPAHVSSDCLFTQCWLVLANCSLLRIAALNKCVSGLGLVLKLVLASGSVSTSTFCTFDIHICASALHPQPYFPEGIGHGHDRCVHCTVNKGHVCHTCVKLFSVILSFTSCSRQCVAVASTSQHWRIWGSKVRYFTLPFVRFNYHVFAYHVFAPLLTEQPESTGTWISSIIWSQGLLLGGIRR